MAHFLKFVVEVKASGLPHVLQLWLGLSQCMLPVRYLCSKKASFCVSEISLRSLGSRKYGANPATLNFGDITRFMAVVSVCLCLCTVGRCFCMWVDMICVEMYVCVCLDASMRYGATLLESNNEGGGQFRSVCGCLCASVPVWFIAYEL